MANDLEAARHVIQNLGDILAELGHAGAAVGTGAGAVILRLMHDLVSRQMLGQRLTLRLAISGDDRTIFRLGLGDILGFAGLQLFELQLKLLDLAGNPFRCPAELHPAQLGDLELELLDCKFACNSDPLTGGFRFQS
jgi:hypothetical protein